MVKINGSVEQVSTPQDDFCVMSEAADPSISCQVVEQVRLTLSGCDVMPGEGSCRSVLLLLCHTRRSVAIVLIKSSMVLQC